MVAKQKQPPQINVVIKPSPLPEAPAYLVSRELTEDERRALRLAWDRMNKEAGTTRLLLLLPEGTDIRALHTEHLKNLRKGIDEALKERGEH